jgi:hypothetical protein
MTLNIENENARYCFHGGGLLTLKAKMKQIFFGGGVGDVNFEYL